MARRSWNSPGLAATLVGLAVAVSACGPDLPVARHVVLISIDTLRADHVGAYASAARTPALDAFAADAVVFEQASAASTTTLPSHTSMLTGRWSIHHGVPRNGYIVHPRNQMLAERLADVGFATLGVSSAQELSKILGFAQGFELWDQDEESFAGFVEANRNARRAETITDAAIAALEARDERPLFLFVHYIDPHSPYDPPEPYRSMYGPIPADFLGSFATIREAQKRHHLAAGAGRAPVHTRLTKRLLQATPKHPLGDDTLLARLYAGEVSYVDHHIGRLFEALRERGLWQDALVLVTSDHGETFWEHADVWSHGLAPYETTVQVPLLVKFPGDAQAGVRVPEPVSGVDITPTVLEAVGLAADPSFDGRSLFQALTGTSSPRKLVSIAPLPATETRVDGEAVGNRTAHERLAPHSLRDGSWKFLRSDYLGAEELYDLAADPTETRNLLTADPPAGIETRADAMRRDLDTWLDNAAPLPSEFYPRTRDRDSPEEAARRRAMWERLRELGYVTEETEAAESVPGH